MSTTNSAPKKSSRKRSYLAWATLVVTTFGAVGTWLALPEIRRLLRFEVQTASSSPSSSQGASDSKSEDKSVAGKKEKRGQDKRANLPYIGGAWRSEYSGKTYMIYQTGDHFEIYENDTKLNQVRTGQGMIVDSGVTAVFHSKKKGRMAALQLALSEDGRNLVGEFKGLDPNEGGPVSFSKI